MGKEKKRKGSCEAEAEAVAERGGGEEKRKKSRTAPSEIKNKEKRSAVHAKLKREKKILKRKQAKARDAAYKKAIELGEEVKSLYMYLIPGFLGLLSLLLLGIRFSDDSVVPEV